MGDKILKKLTLLIVASSVMFAEANIKDLSWVDKEIEAIKPPRKGASLRSVALLKDPFVFLKREKDKKKKKKSSTPPLVVPKNVIKRQSDATKQKASQTLKLKAVINNSALIDGQWYKVGAKIGSYKVVKISLEEVILQNSFKKIVLTTRTNKLNNRMKK